MLKSYSSLFSLFFCSQLVSVGYKTKLHNSLASLFTLKSSRSQIDLNERESVFQSTNHERASSGYSFERIKTGFRDEKSALNPPSNLRERSKEIGGKESEYFERVFIPVNAFRAQNEHPKRRKSILSRHVLRRRADVSSNSGRVFRSFAIHFIHTRRSGEVWCLPIQPPKTAREFFTETTALNTTNTTSSQHTSRLAIDASTFYVQTRVQTVNELNDFEKDDDDDEKRDSPQKENDEGRKNRSGFGRYETLKFRQDYCQKMGAHFNRPMERWPTFLGKKLDVQKLYELVNTNPLKGFETVKTNKQWKDIARVLDPGMTQTRANDGTSNSFSLKCLYKKWVLPFEKMRRKEEMRRRRKPRRKRGGKEEKHHPGKEEERQTLRRKRRPKRKNRRRKRTS